MYDRALTIDQFLSLLTDQPTAIAALTAGRPRVRLHGSPSRGEWSANDVLAHLRSCADMWGKYIATIIAEDGTDDPSDESHDLDRAHERDSGLP